MENAIIDRIECATLIGRRPRLAGHNSRIPVHGLEVELPLIRLRTADGASGFGAGRIGAEAAKAFLGLPLDDLLSPAGRVKAEAGELEFPLWDLLGNLRGTPVYALAAPADAELNEPLRVPCYDTTLLIDDLHLEANEAAAALIAEEARYGYENSHRSFKIKVGRGARWMPLEKGTQRDILVVKAVRDAVGPAAKIMIDANNGYNLNIAKRVLAETADCDIFWLEEAFQEDPALYEDLQGWLEREGLSVLIADGEGGAPPELMDWARDGLVDVIQYDIFSHGFSNWLGTGAQLDEWGVRAAPHHYGRHVGNHVAGHLATAIAGFTFVEWDEVTTPGLDASAYRVEEGQVRIPTAPGFGLKLEEAVFRAAVAAGGFELTCDVT
ncbi:MAG: mandelate racemase [Chloroflexota bacterium]|nr:mandelate racemase [Chloroflexota bacterium]MDE2947762.1 mandelate racemase [Chloroflexota bacterium]